MDLLLSTAKPRNKLGRKSSPGKGYTTQPTLALPSQRRSLPSQSHAAWLAVRDWTRHIVPCAVQGMASLCTLFGILYKVSQAPHSACCTGIAGAVGWQITSTQHRDGYPFFGVGMVMVRNSFLGHQLIKTFPIGFTASLPFRTCLYFSNSAIPRTGHSTLDGIWLAIH